jgi:uncharacterized protein with PIN domain
MKFLADRTTGKLAKKLRALGFDVLYRGEGRIEEAVQAARAEGRMFLTRSRRIPASEEDLQVMILEANSPRDQVREVLQKLRLEPPRGKYFTRCLLCNEELLPATKGEVEGRVPDFIFRGHDFFHRCPRCRRVYWPGTHLEKMRQEVDRILSGEDQRPGNTGDRMARGLGRRKEAGKE